LAIRVTRFAFSPFAKPQAACRKVRSSLYLPSRL
jgi:hypothetical protein